MICELDLPSLKSINLGENALAGRDDSSCSFLLKGTNGWIIIVSDLPKLESLTSVGDSFIRVRNVTFSSC